MKENISVYEALRNHILHFQNAIMNETIYMYVVYITLFTLGFTYDWLFLVSFIVLLVFQSMINCHLWEIRKATIYIEVFFEKERDDIHWERLHRNPTYQLMVVKSKVRSVDWYIRKNGTSLLAILSFLSLLFMSIYNVNFQIQNLPMIAIIQILAALVLCMLTIYTNRLYFRIDGQGRHNNDALSKAINDFFDISYEQPASTCRPIIDGQEKSPPPFPRMG